MCALLTFNAFFRLLSNSEKLIHRILRALMPDNLFVCRHVASALPLIAALWLSASGSVWADLTVTYITATPEASYRTSRVYAGTSKAARRAELGFKRGGEISVVAVDLGDTVAAGQVVARLDARGLGSDLRQAQSEQALAEANRQVATAQKKLAANTERRIRAMRARGHVSQQAFDEANLKMQASTAQLSVARAALKRAEATVDAIKVQLSEAVIRAPFAGVIQARYVDEGSQITPGAPALVLVETSLREAHVGVPESVVLGLTAGQSYPIRWQGIEVAALLRSVLPEVDPNTRTATAVFTFTDQRIPLGAVLELALDERVASEGFWVPLSALTAMDRGLWGLFIVDAENTVQRRLVEILHHEGDRAFVRGLLTPQDRIVATGTQRIVQGQRVLPVAAEFAISAS